MILEEFLDGNQPKFRFSFTEDSQKVEKQYWYALPYCANTRGATIAILTKEIGPNPLYSRGDEVIETLTFDNKEYWDSPREKYVEIAKREAFMHALHDARNAARRTKEKLIALNSLWKWAFPDLTEEKINAMPAACEV